MKELISKNIDLVKPINLFHGDVVDLLEIIPNNFFKLIITSPPYNVGKEYEVRKSLQSYLNEQKFIIEQMVRTLADDGSICWQVGNYVNNGEIFPLDIYYYNIFKDLGLKLRNRIVWQFGHGLHASKRFSGRYETVLWFTKTDDYIFNLDSVRVPSKYPGKRHYKGPKRGELSGNPKGKNPSDFWRIIGDEFENGVIQVPNVKANHPEKTSHPCQFPIELIERFVLALTNENDWVFDPFAGVGTTALAAVKNNRKSVIAEKVEDYILIIEKRIESYKSEQLKYRPLGKKVYQPTGKEKISQIPLEWQQKSSIYNKG